MASLYVQSSVFSFYWPLVLLEIKIWKTIWFNLHFVSMESDGFVFLFLIPFPNGSCISTFGGAASDRQPRLVIVVAGAYRRH